jgi:hypothetical protein
MNSNMERWVELAHAEALAENAAHDAAMQNAQNLTPELLAYLTRPADTARRLPQQLRSRSRRQCVPPWRLA